MSFSSDFRIRRLECSDGVQGFRSNRSSAAAVSILQRCSVEFMSEQTAEGGTVPIAAGFCDPGNAEPGPHKKSFRLLKTHGRNIRMRGDVQLSVKQTGEGGAVNAEIIGNGIDIQGII